MKHLILILMVVVLALAGCQAAASSPAEDEAAAAAAVDAIFTEYVASLEAGDADRWLAQWAEDGIQMPPGAPPNIGKAMITKRVTGMLEKFAVEMDINTDEVIVAGDLALARGMYIATFAPKDGSAPMLIDGKFYTTFKQQPDGSWKIYRDIFNSNVQ